MNLGEKLLNVINDENKKDPFIDVKLAKILDTTRENITALRKELNIPNSRERRKPYLEDTIENILRQNSKITVTDLTKNLMKHGFNISRHVVDEILEEKKLFTEQGTIKTNSMRDPFENLIGYNGSLKTSITQSKAAILYPPSGLPTLILGESGVGKTQFAEAMYNFARQRESLSENMPFVVFNCADYGDNPQLLLSLLYGYKKGAFTGAEKDTDGIVDQADNGILFLDEIHRLPPKGQEILFSILDRGKFRRLGEAYTERQVNIMLIGATTENIESNLLLTFRRRIPMIISIPPLHERSFIEKIELIQNFFQQECNRINLKIFVESKVMEILTLKRFQGNIGQLKSEIQVICARSFMKHIDKKDDIITIGYNEILEISDLKENLILEDIDFIEVKKHSKDMLFIPFINNKVEFEKNIQENEHSLPEDFYKQIETKYYELKALEMGSDKTEEILWSFISNKFDKLNFDINNKGKIFTLTELTNIVDKDIIDSVRRLKLELTKKYSNKILNDNVFTYLAIHLEETVRRLRLKQQIININLQKIKDELPEEYDIALRFSNVIGEKKNILLPEDETGFIAMYIKTAVQDKVLKNRVGIIVLSHGRIATEITKVVKELLGVSFPVAIDMPLDEKPASIYEKAIEISKVVDKGKGILFLVDMGSLTNIGDIVSDRLNIKTRTIDRVDLVTILEAVRKASIPENNLDGIYYGLIRSRYNYPLLGVGETSKPLAIITLCLTGEGMAFYIKEILEKRYENIYFFQMSIMSENLTSDIKKLQQQYNVMAIIGTINPEIEGVNFIPYEPELLNSGIKNLDVALSIEKSSCIKNALENILDDDLILFEPDVKSKRDLIEIICSLIINKGYVKKDFLDSVLNREDIAPTYSKGDIALPHGDSTLVNKSSIVFVKLKESISWDVGKVDIVCLPALKVNDKNVVKGIVKLLLNSSFIESLKNIKDKAEFKKFILSKMKEG